MAYDVIITTNYSKSSYGTHAMLTYMARIKMPQIRERRSRELIRAAAARNWIGVCW